MNARSRRKHAAFTLVELLIVIAILSLLAAILLPVFARVRENARGTACLSNLRQFGTAFAQYLADYEGVYPLNRSPDERRPLNGCARLEGSGKNWRRSLWPYIKSVDVFRCPSNGYLWTDSLFTDTRGDETNEFYPRAEHLPNSYAYNGTFFHEEIPCRYGEPAIHPRAEREITAPSRLIVLTESRHSFPDLTTNFFHPREFRTGPAQAFQTHNGTVGFLFADGHVKRLKLGTTCAEGFWTDRFPDPDNGCARVGTLAPEYR
jgi:prepilin-type N-terminal cleavage/methylation domain-containing protein/prepilin-type processing-associated H-X9-DG protein